MCVAHQWWRTATRLRELATATRRRPHPGFSTKLLILEEPPEGIQPIIINDIGNAIRTLAESGEMAILLVEQYYDFARDLSDHYLLMERGEIVMRGAGEDMDADWVREESAV